MQATFESALHQLQAYVGRTAFAGRTDAGVHASGQVVSCDVRWAREPRRLLHALNGTLPCDIRVLSCRRTDPHFHARFDAVSRQYRYRVAETRVLAPQHASFIWAREPLIDENLASSAACMFEGSHRFGSFASAGVSQRLKPSELERTVLECSWSIVDAPVVMLPTGRRLHELRIRADGFLPQMVRNIMSAIVTVATGNQALEWLEYLLVSGDRRLLGPPAPPHGLTLWDVEYLAGLDDEIRSTG